MRPRPRRLCISCVVDLDVNGAPEAVRLEGSAWLWRCRPCVDRIAAEEEERAARRDARQAELDLEARLAGDRDPAQARGPRRRRGPHRKGGPNR